MVRLDPTGQRIVGVLIEKQLTVPDSYPLTENALVAGCNQSSNRDPVMDLQGFQVAGALMALHEQDVVARVEGSGRVPKYRHKLGERLAVDEHSLAVLAELLLRGPQAPGALKPRVARMGFHATPEQIEAVLRELAAQTPPIVEQLSHRPRERDRRWQHRLGDGSSGAMSAGSRSAAAAPAPGSAQPAVGAAASQPPPRDVAAVAATAAAPAATELLARLLELERRVAAIEQAIAPNEAAPNGAAPNEAAPNEATDP